MVKTKIICTLGPASSSEAVLRKMMLAGMDAARLNFSHGSAGEHARRIELVRKLNRKYRRHVRILQDLEGFRIRIGTFRSGKEKALKKREVIWLMQGDEPGSGNAVSFDYHGPLAGIRAGQHIFIDDGNIALSVEQRFRDKLKTRVLVPGALRERKGVNIPGVRLQFKGLTAKDKNDIRFGIGQGVDFIAQSFVRQKEDVLAVRRQIGDALPACGVIAKIENREGIRNIDEIVEAADGIMIARGDMGVSIPVYEVPFVQKMIIKKCNRRQKFVITATQMLESMTGNPMPTRAEAADVANAILDGSDYLMLSAETAVGRYPVEAVRMMNDVIRFAEQKTGKGSIQGRSCRRDAVAVQ